MRNYYVIDRILHELNNFIQICKLRFTYIFNSYFVYIFFTFIKSVIGL